MSRKLCVKKKHLDLEISENWFHLLIMYLLHNWEGIHFSKILLPIYSINSMSRKEIIFAPNLNPDILVIYPSTSFSMLFSVCHPLITSFLCLCLHQYLNAILQDTCLADVVELQELVCSLEVTFPKIGTSK